MSDKNKGSGTQQQSGKGSDTQQQGGKGSAVDSGNTKHGDTQKQGSSK